MVRVQPCGWCNLPVESSEKGRQREFHKECLKAKRTVNKNEKRAAQRSTSQVTVITELPQDYDPYIHGLTYELRQYIKTAIHTKKKERIRRGPRHRGE